MGCYLVIKKKFYAGETQLVEKAVCGRGCSGRGFSLDMTMTMTHLDITMAHNVRIEAKASPTIFSTAFPTTLFYGQTKTTHAQFNRRKHR
jgi:hypothetical protein